MSANNRTILVFSNPTVTVGYRKTLEHFMRQANMPMDWIRWEHNLTQGCTTPDKWGRPTLDYTKLDLLRTRIAGSIRAHKPRVIILQNQLMLEFISGKELTLGVARGGVYYLNGIPCIVINDMRSSRGFPIINAIPYAGFLFIRDLKKVMRFYENKISRSPAFAYTVCDTVAAVRHFQDAALSAVFMGCDTETAGRGPGAVISCASWACLFPDGTAHTFVVPWLHPCRPSGTLWSDQDFATVLQIMRDVNNCAVPKGLQNGSYDGCYYIRNRMPPRNWIVDTAVAWHSIYAEIPKRIDFIASIACDLYRYWKDEGKEDEKDDIKGGQLPRTEEGWDRYLRYNALDSHYIIPLSMFALRTIHSVAWVAENYRQSMRQMVGPAEAMSMRGVPVNPHIQSDLSAGWRNAAETAINRLSTMVDTPNFNPNSPPQVERLIYDILRATPLPKKGKGKAAAKRKTDKAPSRPTDENTLKLIATQHPLFDIIINAIWDTKKPGNNLAKYGKTYRDDKGKWHGLQLWPGSNRWLYKLNPIATETGRYGSKKHDFWMGQQIQNPPPEMRCMVEAPEGWCIWKADLSKADFFHTAFASEEPNMMSIVMREVAGEIDVHCYHAAQFFSKSYEEIYRGYKEKAEWVVHSTRGVRQNTKRIVYGANYLMAGYTLLVGIMGKEAVDATAAFMGRSRVGWTIKDYASFCQELIDYYFTEMYPSLQPWLERTIRYAATHGNRITCCGGRTRTFFADLLRDNAAQRELAAFFGQGGTACTINSGLDRYYYGGYDTADCHVLWQLHDEVGGVVRGDKLHLLQGVREALLVENEIHGRKFTIPVDIEVGRGWGFRTIGWKPTTTYDEIQKADDKWKQKNAGLLLQSTLYSSQGTPDLENLRQLVI